MKEIKKRNKYLHKKVIKNEKKPFIHSDENQDEELNETVVTKWYEELNEPTDFPEIKESEIIALKSEAEVVLKKEEEFHSKKASRNGHPDKSWLRTVMAKGTASDKVAAYIVTIQDAPVYNLSLLRNLVNMVKVSKKKECLVVMETLTDLFTTDLLRPGCKLRTFEQHPLSMLQELTSGNAMTRKKYLSYWAFEDQLKILYCQFIAALDAVSKDTVEANREKAVTGLYKLLARNPEQEVLLLKTLVNKLGDPNQKVVSKVIYSLTQLLRVHPVMKQVVANEIERFLFRPNIGSRAQYYAVCFLSQYLFFKEDAELAENMISIYFSFFKANIKKGDIDSRMMGALLMGVNRAFPYAKMERSELTEHVDTLYRLVHVCSFNICVQTLCLLYQIVGSENDRFYCSLYKKLLDPHLFTSAHQAMFINLVYKALTKDSNIPRVRVFIKRLLQICLNGPSNLGCGLLYLVSQLIAKRAKLLAIKTQKQFVYEADDPLEDEEEHYTDAPIEGEVTRIGSENAEEKEDEPVGVKPEINSKPGWFHCKNTATKVRDCKVFNGQVRNPAHGGGEFAAYEELTTLTSHFHPTVALFARNILDKQPIKYSGDPLQDFTLLRFLERFVFKNPKQSVEVEGNKGPDPCLAQRKHYVATGSKAVSITSDSFRQQSETNVPVDELFLYRYLQQKQPSIKKEKTDDEDDSDVESVASDEFNEMLDNMVGKVNDDIDFADEIGDKLKNKKNSKKQHDAGTDSDSENDIDEDDDVDMDEEEDLTDLDDEADDEEDEAIDFGEEGEDFDEEIDFNNLGSDEDDFEDEGPLKSSKNKKMGSKGINSMFAPAEQFAEMLEEAGASKLKLGTAQDVSNKDNAALKQLEWESKRNQRSYGGKRKQFGKGSKNQSFHKSKKRRH